MQSLHLKTADYQLLSTLSDLVEGLSVISALNYHADLNLVVNDVAAERDGAKLVANGGRIPIRTICIQPDIYKRLVEVSFDNNLEALKNILNISAILARLPIILQPCRFTTRIRAAVAKGDTVTINMDTLSATKNVTVTAMDANDTDLADPAPQTIAADANGDAYVEMIVPAGYAGNKIKFRIDKDIVDVDEFGADKPDTAITNDSEVHSVTVTA